MSNQILKAVKEIKGEENSSKSLLEYYLIENDEDEFGVKVLKKDDSMVGIMRCSEQHTLEYIVGEEDDANDVLELLAKNTVTPVTVGNVLEDLGYVV